MVRMSPRSSADQAQLTRQRIIDTGVVLASANGLNGVSIGSIAEAMAMSKAGIIGPFASKSELQQAMLTRATQMFFDAVVAPSSTVPAGLPRLRQVITCWTAYLADSPFPNGCFITAVSCELDAHPSPLRDQLRQTVLRWQQFLREHVIIGKRAGDIPRHVDPDDTVETLIGLAMAANQGIQLLDDHKAAQRARRLMIAALGAAQP